MGAQGAKGQGIEALACQLIAADRGNLQQGTPCRLGPGSDRIGQFHVVELLIAPQADEQRLGWAFGEAG